MTARDIETLCAAFYTLRFEEIHALDIANLPWLPRVSGLRLLAAVDAIRNALKAIHDPKERLQRVATLYSWLVPRGIFRTWFLYRLNRDLAELKPTNVMMMLEASMRSRGCGSGGAIIGTGSAVYFSVMTRDVARETIEHRLLCFCIKNGVPFVAIHAPGGILDRATISEALAFVLGDPEQWMRGCYDDLNSAFSAAL